MFYKRDMKLWEIIKFTTGVIKRNKRIYINLFLMYMVWNVINSAIRYALPEKGALNFFVTMFTYIISFCVMMGVRRTIYESIYDESYSDDFDKDDIIKFVKERWLKAIIATTVVGFVISLLTMLSAGLPMAFIIFDVVDNGFSFRAILGLILVLSIMYMAFVIFTYYTLEFSINNNIETANSEVISVVKIKGAKSFLTVLPLGIFSILLYLGWIFMLFGAFISGYNVMSELTIGNSNVLGLILDIITVAIISFINVYMQALWIVKYYNMKNAIVNKIKP